MMTFQDAIRICFQKYADFSGRAKRAEFWWFYLFVFLVSIALSIVHHYLGALFQLGILVPLLAVGARRMHDTGRSGWWQLIGLIPIIGWIVVIVFLAQEGKPDDAITP